MGCSSCGTGANGKPKGCKSNGSCSTGGCEKLSVFDWLSNMTLPSGEAPFNVFEVRFKNGRKNFYKNTEKILVSMGDVVAVEGNPGHDIGVVSLTGELVKVQMRKRKVGFDDENIKKIYRKASQKDIDVWQSVRSKELKTQTRGREIISKLGLQMKLSDVEYQGDGNKATFYYTAENRVDFRELIKDLATEFSIRVEMKQLGVRQEAARLGGIGSCGRELCCSTWLTDFRKVTTSAARYQHLSLNPLKLAGQCGKLKCCLNFELDTYLEALEDFPDQRTVLKTEKGEAYFVKMDIFQRLLWFTYKEDSSKWFKLTLDQVNEIIELNKNNELADSLDDYESETEISTKIDFEDAVGQGSLTRFDTPKKSRRRKRRNNSKSPQQKNNNQQKERKKSSKNSIKSAKDSENSLQVKKQDQINNKQQTRKNVNEKSTGNVNNKTLNQRKQEAAKKTQDRKQDNKKRNNQKTKNNNND